MPKAKNTEGAESAVIESETNINPEENAEGASEGLSLRSALKAAIQGADEEAKPDAKSKTETPTGNVEAVRESGTGTKDAPKAAPLEPPSEYTEAEKADFRALSRTGQEAQLRLDNSRKTKIEEIRLEKEDLKKQREERQWLADLEKEITPFLKTNGRAEKGAREEIVKALKAVNELDTGDPIANAIAYIKARGEKVPEALLQALEARKGVTPEIDGKISPLQERLNAVERELASRKENEEKAKSAELGRVLSQEFSVFENEKNAAGKPKYPDLVGDSEAVTRLGSIIGTLTSGVTQKSKDYIASVAARIPNLTFQQLFAEAYRYGGGRVDDSESTPRSQTSQTQIVKSRRAASSVPGRGAQTSSSGPVKKFKTYREAAAAALADLNSD